MLRRAKSFFIKSKKNEENEDMDLSESSHLARRQPITQDALKRQRKNRLSLNMEHMDVKELKKKCTVGSDSTLNSELITQDALKRLYNNRINMEPPNMDELMKDFKKNCEVGSQPTLNSEPITQNNPKRPHKQRLSLDTRNMEPPNMDELIKELKKKCALRKESNLNSAKTENPKKYTQIKIKSENNISAKHTETKTEEKRKTSFIYSAFKRSKSMLDKTGLRKKHNEAINKR